MSSSSSTSIIPLSVKWGKETLQVNCVPAAGSKRLKQDIEEVTGVPADRIKLMAKSKGLWKGVLKDDFDLQSIDWAAALQQQSKQNGGSSTNGSENTLSVLLVGSATKLAAPAQKTVFLEDLPPEMAAAVQEPAGLVNLGNTCYMNSVVQCLRAVPSLRTALQHYNPAPPPPGGLGGGGMGGSTSTNRLMVATLRDTLQRLDRQTDPLQPVALLQATRVVFPQFAQRGPQGQPMQQDAEEFLSGLLAAVANELTADTIRTPTASSSQESITNWLDAQNFIDALFGIKMKQTLQCSEIPDMGDDPNALKEPAVITFDLHRKLVCNIQGGSDAASSTNVSHIGEGIQLGLTGTIEKHSSILGRNAIWTKTVRMARLPPILTVQFGRFYWKPTPDSEDHAGVKCKIMKPVAFSDTLDVFDFCTEDIQKILKASRDKALKEQDDLITAKLKGQLEAQKAAAAEPKDDDGNVAMAEEAATTTSEGETAASKPAAALEVDTTDKMDEGEDDDDLKAAMAMSMEEILPAVGPGLPENFQGIYELFAVVTHKGRDADGGHYMAWVKADTSGVAAKDKAKIADTNVENEDWFVFNDDEVSPCKTEDVLKLKGGGDWHMSYLNFYRAKK